MKIFLPLNYKVRYRSPWPRCSCSCVDIFLSERIFIKVLASCFQVNISPDHVNQRGRGVGLDPCVPQLRQLLVVRLAVVAELGGEGRGQLEEGDLDPVHLGVAVQQLQTLRRHQAVAVRGVIALK